MRGIPVADGCPPRLAALIRKSYKWFPEMINEVEFFKRFEELVRNDKEKCRAGLNASYHKHAERRRADAREQRASRRKDAVKMEKYREWCRAYKNARRKTNPQYRLTEQMRNRIRMALSRTNVGKKSARTFELLGCTVDELRAHLESQWLPGMSWDNHGPQKHCWHIDHRIPCASFDLSDPEQQRKCFHFSNLQPLWALDNWSKADKIPTLIKP